MLLMIQSRLTKLFECGRSEAKMKEATVIWAKLFLLLIILAKPLGLNGHIRCKHLGNNSCLSNTECCSGYCYKEPGWGMGVCKRPKFSEYDGSDTDNVWEKGICAYYKGDEITANGDVYDEYELTAAHRTLPFNTKVNVEIMGASVVVRINDRQNTSSKNLLDMSFAAAEGVDITKKGPVPCQITVMNDVGCTPNLAETCQMDHECCSNYCFKQMFATAGFCISK
ncbi:uncharacterized protein LOC113554489 [Rhopalosiphum maidis]|uniref:uncharacterized protein LOC113554489 n=1 Tax=Rhopalosiphum maidis TaxID=43146 RepID=UPI000EFE61D9|nr:uncharacterized protein LOC113554489 [Rhopalosiphum maidis]